MPPLDHFKFIATYYDRIMKTPESDTLIRLVGLAIHGPILNDGGGTGRVDQLFRTKASQVIVLDLSIGMLKQAYLKGILKSICSFTEALPFQVGSFERIITCRTILRRPMSYGAQ